MVGRVRGGRARLLLAGLGGLLAFSGGALGADALLGADTGRVAAISANPSSGQDPLTPFALAARAGARGTFMAFSWSELEPSSGRFRLAPLGVLRTLGAERGLKLLLGIEPVNTASRETPPDLEDAEWDSPLLRARFRALIDALLPSLNRNVAYLSIGNEVDVYLARHPGEWAAYTRFYEDAVAYVHEVAPWLEVGVTSTWSGAVRSQKRKVARLNRSSDVEILTYYPLERDLRVRRAQAPLVDFPRMLGAAAGRPLVLQEVGYPASPLLASSARRQARFVKTVFAAWRRAGGARVPFVNFLLMHDLDRDACGRIARLQGRPDNERLLAYLCTLGLRRANGEAKLAWSEFARGASALSKKRR